VNSVISIRLARISVALFPLSLFAACASSPSAPTSAEIADAKTPVCVREYRVGSNIPVVNCAVPQTEAERQRTVDEFKSQMHQIPSMGPKGAAGG
jgi:hypothetical protein